MDVVGTTKQVGQKIVLTLQQAPEIAITMPVPTGPQIRENISTEKWPTEIDKLMKHESSQQESVQ